MRIVYTTHQFFPDYSAGTESLTYHTAREFMSRGHDVRVFTAYPVRGNVERSNYFDRYKCDGLPVERFFHCNVSPTWPMDSMQAEYNNIFFAHYFRKRLQVLKPDIVHFYHLQRLSVSPIDVCAQLGIPTILTATDFWLMCPKCQLLLPDHSLCLGPDKTMVNCLRHLVSASQQRHIFWIFNRMPKPLLALLIRLAKYRFWPEKRYVPLVRSLAARSEHIEKRINQVDKVLVATQFMAEKLRSFGVEPKRICHVPFAIDTTLIKGVSEKGSRRELRVGFIGTLSHHKGAHLLIEAVRLLSPRVPLKVRIYGAQHQFPEYARTLRELAGNDPRVEFCGTFPNSEIGDVLFELDVLVVPSLWYENSPLVLHSAQAAKVPVVATNVGGLSEMITDGANGFLFERGPARALSSIIQLLSSDAPLLDRLSRNSRAPRPITNYVDELGQIYGDVMKCRARC